MLSRSHRIKGERDVSRVYRRGQSVRLGQLTLKHVQNQLGHSRLAVVVSKKTSKSAPKRNRIRRRIYEHYRQSWSNVSPGHDIIISVFSDEVASQDSTSLSADLDELLKRAKLWVDAVSS